MTLLITLSKTSSLPDAIINACNPMQNLGQTRIFLKVDQTYFTWKKCDPDYPDDPIWFHPRCKYI